jgi:hypothetical protein
VTRPEKGNQVVYLSHEGDDFHGQILGDNFIDFINNMDSIRLYRN